MSPVIARCPDRRWTSHDATVATFSQRAVVAVWLLAISVLVVLCVPSAALASNASREVDLRPKFELGREDSYRFQIKTDETLRQPDLSQVGNPDAELIETTSEQRRAINFRLVCRSVDDEGADVEFIIDRVFITEMKEGRITWVFDSTKPASPGADPRDEATRSLVGSVIHLRYDKQGRIVSVRGGENFMRMMPGGAALPAGSPADAFGALTGLVPEKTSAEVGEKWTTESRLAAGPLGHLALTTEYQLESFRNGVAKIETDGRVEQASSSGGSPGQGLGVGIEIGKCKHAGRYEWDTRMGRLKSYTTKLELEAAAGLSTGRIEHRSVSVFEVCLQDK